MEFKGTKGKWITEKFDLEGYEKSILIVSKNDNKQIAEVNFEYLRNDDYVYNALLISKAPEMLEMLQKIVLMTEICNGTFEDFRERYNTEIKQLIKEATEL